MLQIRQGRKEDAASLAPLILLSANKLLPYIFGSSKQALDYLLLACTQDDGQYSASRHQVITHEDNVVACMSLWQRNMPESFHQHTLSSLGAFLSPEQLVHILSINDDLKALFRPPEDSELCIGHLAVDLKWQGQGLAKQLLAHAVGEAKRLHKHCLVLDVDTASKEALGFYKRSSFVGEQKQVYRATSQTFVRMSLSVK